MSVRRAYNLVLDNKVVFSGSYKSVMDAYSISVMLLQEIGFLDSHVLVVSFQPDVLKGV